MVRSCSEEIDLDDFAEVEKLTWMLVLGCVEDVSRRPMAVVCWGWVTPLCNDPVFLLCKRKALEGGQTKN